MAQREQKEYSISDLISKAKSDEAHPNLYVNFAQVLMTNNELILDLYTILPVAGQSPKVQVTLIQRVLFPINLAKGLSSAIANVVANYEEDHDLILPNPRSQQEDDKITIWP